MWKRNAYTTLFRNNINYIIDRISNLIKNSVNAGVNKPGIFSISIDTLQNWYFSVIKYVTKSG